MTSQIGQQIISLTILSKVSRSKAIHAMKFGRIIKHSMRTIFFKILSKNEASSSRPLLSRFKKLYMR